MLFSGAWGKMIHEKNLLALSLYSKLKMHFRSNTANNFHARALIDVILNGDKTFKSLEVASLNLIVSKRKSFKT
jgi:hypothetical protein